MLNPPICVYLQISLVEIKMNIQEKLYYKVANRFPSQWKLLRIIFFGKHDFNDLTTWENDYIDTYDLENLHNRVPEVVNHILNQVEHSASVLEISAGYGNFISKVPSGKVRFATEFSKQAISILEGLNIKTKKCILPNLPFENVSFDAVVSISVFEHLNSTKTVRESFEEIHRVCRDVFILSVPFESMRPPDTLMHNHDFSKEDILKYSHNLFELKDWKILDNGKVKRSVSVLKKIR